MNGDLQICPACESRNLSWDDRAKSFLCLNADCNAYYRGNPSAAGGVRPVEATSAEILCVDCGEANVEARVVDGVHDLKCRDCGAVFGEGNLPIADRVYICGRAFLRVGRRYYLAMEGDVIRDPSFAGRVWTQETLLEAAKAINAVAKSHVPC